MSRNYPSLTVTVYVLTLLLHMSRYFHFVRFQQWKLEWALRGHPSKKRSPRTGRVGRPEILGGEAQSVTGLDKTWHLCSADGWRIEMQPRQTAGPPVTAWDLNQKSHLSCSRGRQKSEGLLVRRTPEFLYMWGLESCLEPTFS